MRMETTGDHTTVTPLVEMGSRAVEGGGTQPALCQECGGSTPGTLTSGSESLMRPCLNLATVRAAGGGVRPKEAVVCIWQF